MGNMYAPSLTCRTYLLRRAVCDPADLAAHPENYLVDITEQPKEAARIWAQSRRSDGLLSLTYGGRQGLRERITRQ